MSHGGYSIAPPSDDFIAAFQRGEYDQGVPESEFVSASRDVGEGVVYMHSGDGHDELAEARYHGIDPFDGEKQTFTYNVGFVIDDMQNDGVLETTITEQDWRDMIAENPHVHPDMSDIDLSRVALSRVAIAGTTLPKRSKYALQVFDRTHRPIYKVHAYKNNQSAAWDKFGHPLYVDNPVLLRTSDKLSREMRLYGKIKMSDFEDGVLTMNYPATPNQPARSLVLVSRHSKAAALLVWILERCNKAVNNMMGSQEYTDPKNPDYLCVSRDMWDDVVTAYRERIEKDVNFYDLSLVTVRLVPVSVGAEFALTGARAGADIAQNGAEHIALEFTGHMMPK